MLGISSSTGLLAARIQPIYKVKPKKIELSGTSKPAPFILRPFAGIFNPYPYGCSIFCNHPADCEAKEFVRRAKESWATEGKALLLPAEMEMIRATLTCGIVDSSGINDVTCSGGFDINPITNVPDELFRKYTDTDSRPLTPTPTLASGPLTVHRDDIINFNVTCNPKERTTLILDLRTASQEHDIETLNWHAVTLEPPPSPARKNNQISKFHSSLSSTHHHQQHHNHHHRQSQQTSSVSQEIVADINEGVLKSDDNHENNENVDEIIIKRRGKRLKKRKCRRGSTYGQQCEVRDPLEPLETQVSQVNGGSRKNSALTPLENVTAIKTPEDESITSVQQQQQQQSTSSSFISPEILKHIIRDLDNEMIEQEFFLRRKIVMIEALRVKNELQLQNRSSSRQSFVQFPLAVNSPRIFSRQNARFELLDSASLATMNSIDYLGKHVFLAHGRKLMFGRTFNKYYEDTMDGARYISSNDVIEALNEIMGKPLSHEQMLEFEKIIGKIVTPLNFRTWCGICAACERLLSPLPPRKLDMPSWIERTDFQALERRLQQIEVNEKLHYLLIQIRDR